MTADPYAGLDLLPFECRGWLVKSTKDGLLRALEDPSVLRVVEIGSFLGLSAMTMANVLKPRGGTLYAVDPWVPTRQTAIAVKPEEDIWRQFLSNVVHAKLTETIVPIRGLSVDVAMTWPHGDVDLVYVDGDHSAQAVKQDICCWWQHLRVGGVLCGDDWNWPELPGAIVEAAILCGTSICEVDQNFWRLQPKAVPIKSSNGKPTHT